MIFHLKLALRPRWCSPGVARLCWTSLCLNFTLRTWSPCWWSIDHNVTRPCHVPDCSCSTTSTLVTVPHWPGAQLTIHWTINSAAHLGVTRLTQMVTEPRWHWSSISTNTSLTSTLHSLTTRRITVRSTGGPVCEVPGVGPAGAVGDAAPGLLEGRTYRVGFVWRSKNCSVARLPRVPRAL